MSTTFSSAQQLWPWRALYWEPVPGTGERIVVGVVHGYAKQFRAMRTIRLDVLDCLFGKSAPALLTLLDESISMFQAAAEASESLESVSYPVLGIYPGEIRLCEAVSSRDLIETACLLTSSLASLDKLDEAEESDAPQQEEVNRRFSSEVKDEVMKTRPDLAPGFGRTAVLVNGGQRVRFGFLLQQAVLHFTVLHPVRQSASMRDARAKIFELQRAREISGFARAALIAGAPSPEDPSLGSKQREQLRANQFEIEQEADAVNLRWHAVHSAKEAASKLIEVVA